MLNKGETECVNAICHVPLRRCLRGSRAVAVAVIRRGLAVSREPLLLLLAKSISRGGLRIVTQVETDGRMDGRYATRKEKTRFFATRRWRRSLILATVPYRTAHLALKRSISRCTYHIMDYQGQRLAEILFYWIILSFGAIGWIFGYFQQDFFIVVQFWLVGVVLSVIVSTVVVYFRSL